MRKRISFENGMHWVKEDSWWVVKRYEKVSSWEELHLDSFT